jgi:RHS repeat-associated protein
LQYFEKRYYDNRIWRFTTEDPVYWEVGLTKRPNTYFTDPQQWNSYSYVRNNPINLVDPTGESSSNPWQQFMDTLWQLYDAWATNIGNDVKSEAKAYQQAGTTLVQNLPWTWDVWDAYALATGKDLYSGEDVSGWNRALTAAAIFIPWVSGGEMRAGKDGVKAIVKSFSLDAKILGQMEKRWWTESKISNALQSKNTAIAMDKSTWQKATAYFVSTNQYVVKNNETGKIIQISNLNDKAWKVDTTIKINSKK